MGQVGTHMVPRNVTNQLVSYDVQLHCSGGHKSRGLVALIVKGIIQQDRQCTHNVKIKRVHETIVSVQRL
jgi:hypothetical protein